MASKILVVDDESAVRTGLRSLLKDAGYSVAVSANGRDALRRIEREEFAVVLADLAMPGLDGLELLKRVRPVRPYLQFIIITARGSIATAVEAMKAGAYDYLAKPVRPDRLRSLLPKALEHHELLLTNARLQERLEALTAERELIGESRQMNELYRMIDAVAGSSATVLITGESGTGKELVARAIHNRSGRADAPFVAVNCSAFPRDLLESELFGHEKGAFTGAVRDKPGCFEFAHTGTLFLDEIGEMALETQTKILRALEERRFRRLGGKEEIQVDLRVLAATNRDLKKAIADQVFRQDLYYRLCVVEIAVPPLRERPDDIPILAAAFIRHFTLREGSRITGLDAGSRERLLQYPWPGNVRELRNVIERAVLLCPGELITAADLPEHISASSERPAGLELAVPASLKSMEKKLIRLTLDFTGGDKKRAAEMLGISLKTLYNKLA